MEMVLKKAKRVNLIGSVLLPPIQTEGVKAVQVRLGWSWKGRRILY